MVEINRPYLIFWMLGYIEGQRDILMKDALIILDNTLIDMGQPPITKEEKLLFKDFEAEIEYALLAAKINRKTSRDLGIHRLKIRK